MPCRDKQSVIETVQGLPEEATLDEISEEVAILAAIRRGEAAAEAGNVVPHAEVEKRFAEWTSK